MKENMTTEVRKGMEFVTEFGSAYRVLRVMPKSGKATLERLKSGATSNWKISEVLECLVKDAARKLVNQQESIF